MPLGMFVEHKATSREYVFAVSSYFATAPVCAKVIEPSKVAVPFFMLYVPTEFKFASTEVSSDLSAISLDATGTQTKRSTFAGVVPVVVACAAAGAMLAPKIAVPANKVTNLLR
jgi:hypothetical protein